MIAAVAGSPGAAQWSKRLADIPLDSFEGEFLLAYDGENGSATCGGDSGGPVFELVDGEIGGVVAVHSFGRDDDGTICAGSISGATHVAGYLDWIVAETGAQTDALAVDDVASDTAGESPPAGDDGAVAGCDATGGAWGGWGVVFAAWVAGSRGRKWPWRDMP